MCGIPKSLVIWVSPSNMAVVFSVVPFAVEPTERKEISHANSFIENEKSVSNQVYEVLREYWEVWEYPHLIFLSKGKIKLK